MLQALPKNPLVIKGEEGITIMHSLRVEGYDGTPATVQVYKDWLDNAIYTGAERINNAFDHCTNQIKMFGSISITSMYQDEIDHTDIFGGQLLLELLRRGHRQHYNQVLPLHYELASPSTWIDMYMFIYEKHKGVVHNKLEERQLMKAKQLMS